MSLTERNVPNDWSGLKPNELVYKSFNNNQDIKTTDYKAICPYKDNVFNKYSFYYVNEKRNKSVVYFDTYKGSKYVIASNRDHSVKNDHDLFLIDEGQFFYNFVLTLDINKTYCYFRSYK